MIRHDQPDAVRLVRMPIDGGESVEIPIDGDWRPVPGGLGSQAVGPDGSIISRVASKHSWFWPLGIIDPRSGRVEVLDFGPDVDSGGGWTHDGRIVATVGPTLSTLWRFRPVSPATAR